MEAKERGIHDRKERAKVALAAGKVPQKKEGEETGALPFFSSYLVSSLAETGFDYDDEYGQAGIQEPRILITTSRDPSSRLQQFAKVWLAVYVFEQNLTESRKSDLSFQTLTESIEVTTL